MSELPDESLMWARAVADALRELGGVELMERERIAHREVYGRRTATEVAAEFAYHGTSAALFSHVSGDAHYVIGAGAREQMDEIDRIINEAAE